MAKGEFEWDLEEVIGEVFESDKVKHEIKQCELNGAYYISATKWVLKKDGWSITKNQVFKKSVFVDIVAIVTGLK